MGIWIRSQDKEKLIKCEDIQISGTDIVNFTRYGVVELGKYSTKEKALNVLDMIQECIESNNSHHNSQWDSTPHLVYNVFQMPQDEVE